MNSIDSKCYHYKNIKCEINCKTIGCKNCKDELKLMKNTCQQCYDLKNSQCNHMDFQRAITGFLCTNEVQKALQKGYYIYEVWHFKETSEDLWRRYIRKFLTIKLETSKFSYSEEEHRRKTK
jgi:hypothetical protein